MSDFQVRAKQVALNHYLSMMFTGSHFSICNVNEVLGLMGIENYRANADYQALSSLHCLSWDDIPSDVRVEMPRIISKLSGISIMGEKVIEPVVEKRNLWSW